MECYFKYKINNIPVVFEDDWLLVVNKPAGLLTIPNAAGKGHSLSRILNEDLKKKGLSYRLHPCHRLDRETSGLIIYAKGKSVQKKMMDEFKHKKVRKTYIAFLHGRISRNEGTINMPIEGRFAQTQYKVMQRRKDFTVAEAHPLTGRKNQLRLHFKHMGHPLVGETKFAFRSDFKLKAKHLCLYAKRLDFIHPLNKRRVSLSQPLPLMMQEFLTRH